MRRPHVVPVAATACFAVLALLYAIDQPVYVALLDAIHAHPFARPFLDTRFVTAQVECWRRGIDVYVRNPCDPLGRTLDYSPLWLRLRFLAQPERRTWLFGLAVDGAFLLALFRIPWMVDGGFELVVTLAAVLSWATAFAMERGNTDLVMFAAAVLFAHLAMRGTAARSAGYAVVLVAGLLKFYPLAMLALLVRETRARIAVVGGVVALVLAAFVAGFHAELGRIGGNMAAALFGDMFGARGLPFGLPLLLGHVRIRAASGVYVGEEALGPGMAVLAWALLVVLSGCCLLVALAGGRRLALRAVPDRLDAGARMMLPVGCVLCVGCFFAHQNIGYRSVLLLLVLPGVLGVGRAASGWGTRAVLRWTGVLIALVQWDGFLSRSTPGWIVMQLAWWWIVTVLMAVLVCLLRGDVVRLVRGVRTSRGTVRRWGAGPAGA